MRGALVFLAAWLAATAARADDGEDVAQREVRFVEKAPELLIGVGFTDVFDEEMLQQLSSGFATTVVARVYLYREGEDLPVWFSVGTWRAVYDLWDEVYQVRVRGPSGELTLRRPTRADALRELTTMVDFAAAPLRVVDVGPRYFVGVIVEVNPVSPALLAEVRRWLARPQEQVAGNASFFGSFVSIFVNPKVIEADRTLRFRSQFFYRVKP